MTLLGLPLRLFKLRKGGEYSKEQRQFAATLYYYSPAAYGYARRHMPLPHPRTIQKYVQNMHKIVLISIYKY